MFLFPQRQGRILPQLYRQQAIHRGVLQQMQDKEGLQLQKKGKVENLFNDVQQ